MFYPEPFKLECRDNRFYLSMKLTDETVLVRAFSGEDLQKIFENAEQNSAYCTVKVPIGGGTVYKRRCSRERFTQLKSQFVAENKKIK